MFGSAYTMNFEKHTLKGSEATKIWHITLSGCSKEWSNWRHNCSVQWGHRVSNHEHRPSRSSQVKLHVCNGATKGVFFAHYAEMRMCVRAIVAMLLTVHLWMPTFVQQYKLVYMAVCIRKHIRKEICNFECCVYCEQLYAICAIDSIGMVLGMLGYLWFNCCAYSLENYVDVQ